MRSILSIGRFVSKKGKIKWVTKGDMNSKFFYGTINIKRNKSRIRGILVNDSWTEDPFEVKREFQSFFEKSLGTQL